MLRAYLLAVAQKGRARRATGPNYWGLKVGDSVAVNEFTNYDTLSVLIDKFNADMGLKDPSLVLDPTIVTIRDLIAHGRVAASKPDLTDMRIVKFGPPRKGKVDVVACAIMDEAWFDSGIKMDLDQIMKVHSATKGLRANNELQATVLR